MRATEIAAWIGQAVAAAPGFPLMYNPDPDLHRDLRLSRGVLRGAHGGARAVSRGVLVTFGMMTQFATLAPEAHVEEAVQISLDTSQGEFPVVDGRQAGRHPHPR